MPNALVARDHWIENWERKSIIEFYLAHMTDGYRRVTMAVLRLAFLSALVLELLATLGTAVVAVEVGLRLLYAKLAFREALLVLILAPEFYRPLRSLGAAFHAGMAGREAAGRIGDVLDAEGPHAVSHEQEDLEIC